MAELRSEVMKALPYLPDNILVMVMHRLDELGVEGPNDMRLVEERDLACVLKVIQCRKLINHFKTSFGYNTVNCWMAQPVAPSKSVSENKPFFSVNPMLDSIQSSYISPRRDLSTSPETSYARSQCIQSETVSSLPSTSSTTLSSVSVAPFKLSAPFTISEPSSTSEEHSALQGFVTSSTVTNNYAPINLESDMREATPTSQSVTNDYPCVSPLQATSSLKIQDAVEYDASSYEDSACEISAIDQSPGTAERSGEALLNYQLPVHKFTAEIRNILKSKCEIRKPFSHELVRVITADLLSKCSNPSTKEIGIVAKAAVSAYPDSLRNITSGRNAKPGYEAFMNMINNRINNMKYSVNEKLLLSKEPEPSLQLQQKRPIGRPRSKQRSRSSDSSEEMNLATSSGYEASTSASVCGVYRIPLRELSQEIRGCLERNMLLNESSRSLVIQAIVDDLLKANCRPTPETLKHVAKNVVTTYPGSLNSGKGTMKSEMDFFQGLDDEIKKREVKAAEQTSKKLDSRNILLAMKNKVTVNLVPCEVKPLTPFERWNTLRNYKVPLEKFPLYIRKDLLDGIQIEDEIRDEFIMILLQEAMKIVPKPTREDIKRLGKAVAQEYPNSFQKNKSNRFTYLSFLKKLMEISVKVTGDETLAFSTYGKKRKVQNMLCDDDISNISPSELQHFKPLQITLQRKSKTEEWSDYIADAMSTTFPLQRKDIESDVAVQVLKENWPFLFHEKGFLLHLRLLLGNCLKKEMEQNFRDKYNSLLNYFVNQSSNQEHIQEIISDMLICDNMHSNSRRIVLLILDYFGESLDTLVRTSQSHDEDLSSFPSHPCIISYGCFPFSSENAFSVCIQRTLLVKEVSFTTAFVIYFGTYLVFNLQYPATLIHSLEFVQRCIAEIPLRQKVPVSEGVLEKVDMLIRNTQLVI